VPVSVTRPPALSERATRKLALTALRVSEVEQMAATDFPLRNGFGERNLGEEEGGLMEYTRRRHRNLGSSSVHVNKSGAFPAVGKRSTSLIY
jgi:hypothetical protein